MASLAFLAAPALLALLPAAHPPAHARLVAPLAQPLITMQFWGGAPKVDPREADFQRRQVRGGLGEGSVRGG